MEAEIHPDGLLDYERVVLVAVGHGRPPSRRPSSGAKALRMK